MLSTEMSLRKTLYICLSECGRIRSRIHSRIITRELSKAYGTGTGLLLCTRVASRTTHFFFDIVRRGLTPGLGREVDISCVKSRGGLYVIFYRMRLQNVLKTAGLLLLSLRHFHHCKKVLMFICCSASVFFVPHLLCNLFIRLRGYSTVHINY